jgi:hypothetical protein
LKKYLTLFILVKKTNKNAPLKGGDSKSEILGDYPGKKKSKKEGFDYDKSTYDDEDNKSSNTKSGWRF